MKNNIYITLLALLAASTCPAEQFLPMQHPYALYFRRPETVARYQIPKMSDWVRHYSQLNGVIGKCIDEEAVRFYVSPYMKTLKQSHPDQLVILHYNHAARDSAFEINRYWPGHWLYYEGSVALEAISADGDESVIKVKNATDFNTSFGFDKTETDDICICQLGADGKPNWDKAEYVKLLHADTKAGTIRVKRAQYGTTPLAFGKGRAYIAPLAVRFAPRTGKNLRWMYNYSTQCPRDTQGRNCSDILLAELGEWFAEGGYCEGFDGVTFDVSFHLPHKYRNQKRRRIDIDADGKADDAVIDGKNVYGLGVIDFYKNLRKVLGPEKLILSDGQSSQNQRAFGILNGMESEGFPSHHDPQIKDFSGAMNRLLFWQQNSANPRFNYVVHKHVMTENDHCDTPFSTKRLVLAAGPLTDAAIVPGEHNIEPSPDNPAATWDEVLGGTLHKKNWLGEVKGPLIRIGAHAPDILKGAGHRMTADFAAHWNGHNCTIQRNVRDKSLVIKGKDQTSDMKFTFAIPKEHHGDLLVFCTLESAPLPDMGQHSARLIRVSLDSPPVLYPAPGKGEEVPGIMTFAGKEPFRAVFYFRDVAEQKPLLNFIAETSAALTISNVTVHSAADAMAREFENGVILANPSHHNYTFDLQELFPGMKLRRLQATSKQDTKTNNGQPVRGSVTLAPIDALFLLKQ